MSIVLKYCPNDSELVVEGKLPRELKESIQSYLNLEGNGYIINNKNKLNKVFVENDSEITNNLLGLHLYSNSKVMFQGFHIYDYGSESKSGRVVFFHKEAPETLLQELMNKNAI